SVLFGRQEVPDGDHAGLLPTRTVVVTAHARDPCRCAARWATRPAQARNGAATRRSATNAAIARARFSGSPRRIDEGCTVASTCGANSTSSNLPRSTVTRKDGPNTDCAAVAPRSTRTSGCTSDSSDSSHGAHALTSSRVGFWWMRRLPRGVHLKCFTAFVTYTRWRSM